eukprot:jgi/Tetstr1/429387/TSEL_019301.t1
MLTQLTPGLGLTAAPLRAPDAELPAFIGGLRVVRRSFKPSGSPKAANRRYMEPGDRGDSAPPTMTWTTLPSHAAGRPTLNSCKGESISAPVAILEHRITRPAKGRLPLRIPDLRAMLYRGFSTSSAFGRHQRLCITFLNLRRLRRKAPTALTCDHRVSGSDAVSDAELSAVRVLFNAELSCRYIRLRVDVDKNVDAQHDCFAYIPDHEPCLAVRRVGTLEDYLRVFRPPPGGRLLAAPKSSRVGPQC